MQLTLYAASHSLCTNTKQGQCNSHVASTITALTRKAAQSSEGVGRPPLSNTPASTLNATTCLSWHLESNYKKNSHLIIQNCRESKVSKRGLLVFNSHS